MIQSDLSIPSLEVTIRLLKDHLTIPKRSPAELPGKQIFHKSTEKLGFAKGHDARKKGSKKNLLPNGGAKYGDECHMGVSKNNGIPKMDGL